MSTYRKPLAKALTHKNEVTVTVMSKDENINYHETFMLDTTEQTNFEYDGEKYNLPAKDTLHYQPSIWKIDVRLGMFFEKHKLIAKFLDWFKFREKATFELGFLYWKGEPNPVALEPQAWNEATEKFESFISNHDFAMINYDLMKNTTFQGKFEEVKGLYRKPGINMKSLLIFALIIIAIIVALAVYYSYSGGGGVNPQNIQNVTAVNVTATPPNTFPPYFGGP